MPIDTLALARLQMRLAPDAKLVVSGATSTHGTLDARDAFEATDNGGGHAVGGVALTVVAGSIAPALDSVITVGGVRYRVLSPPLDLENGDLVQYLLAKVP